MTVDDAMTRHPATVWTTSSIDDALHRMLEARIRRVPVVDERGRLAGILALDDIFEYLAKRIHPVTPIRRAVPTREQAS
jgi:CBS-domain-containing membrane protein